MGIADTWIATTSGDWTDAANWSGGEPGPGNDAIFPGTIALTITYDTSSTIDTLQGGTNETLAITGGSLSLIDGGNWDGTIDDAGGTLNVLNGSLNLNDLALAAGGTALVQQGATLSLAGGDTLAGTLAGSGDVSLINAGTFALASGLSLGVGTLQLNGATTATLGGDLTDDGNFNLLGGATLALAGHTLTLNGPAFLNGLASGPGTIVAANAVLYAQALTGGAVVQDTGTVVEEAGISMGAGSADTSGLNIDAGATYQMAGDMEISADGTATIANAGLFVKNSFFPSGSSSIQANFDNTGSLVAELGTLFLTGVVTNTGSITVDALLSLGGGGDLSAGGISGPGELDLRSGHTYELGGSVDVGTLALFDPGTVVTLDSAPTVTAGFTLGNSTGLALNGQTLTLPQALLQGTLTGPGTVTVSNATIANTFVVSGGAVVIDAGIATLAGNAELGIGTADSASLQIVAGATLAAPTDTSMTANGTAVIDNAGLIRKSGFTSTSTLAGSVDNTGSIAVDAGTLALSGGNSTLGGTIDGGGELDLRGGGTFTLLSTLSLAPASIGIFDNATQVNLSADTSYFGDFSLGSGATLNLDGSNLGLVFPSTLSGVVIGTGTIEAEKASINGLALVADGTLQDTGTAVLTGQLNMGRGTADTSGVTIGAADTFDILDGSNIIAAGTATIGNAGLFEKTGYDGSDQVQAALDSTGTVEIDAGDLGLDGGGTLGGDITGTGELDLRGGGTYALQPSSAITVGTLEVLDGGTVVQAGSSDAIIGSFTLSAAALSSTNLFLNGAFALNGTVETGVLAAAGTGEVGGLTVSDNGTLAVTGSAVQDSFVQLGSGGTDTAALIIEPSGTYDIYDTQNIGASGTASIANAGLFESTSRSGFNPDGIAAAFSNTGSVNVTGDGDLSFSGAFANTGQITVSEGSLSVSQAATGSGGGIDIGTGGVVAFATAVAGQAFTFTGTQATLDLGDPNGTGGPINGFVAGDTIDLTGIRANGFSYAGSTLTLTQTVNQTLEATYTLDLPGVTGTLAIANDGNGGTDVVLDHTGPVFTTNPGTQLASTWTVDASGDWSTGGNWSSEVVIDTPEGPGLTLEPVVPTASYDVALNPNGSDPFTVSFATNDTVNSLGGNALATLALNSGTLIVNDGGALNGFVTQATGAKLDAVSGLAIGSGFTQASGAIDEVDSQSLAVGGGTLAGTVEGSGNLYLLGGQNYTIEPGFTNTAAGFELGVTTNGFGSMTTLDTDVAYAGRFLLDNVSGNPASLDLNGHTFTLSGTAGLYGLINGPGTVSLTGSAELMAVDLLGGMAFDDSGSVVQDSVIGLGGSTADTSSISIGAGDTWDITDTSGVNADGKVSIDNAGLFEKTNSTGDTFIGPNFTNTGTLLVATGTLLLNGLNSTLGGTIEGAGDLALRGPGSYTIEPGVVLTVATLDLALGGDADNSFTTLDTNLTYNGHFSVDNVSGNPAFLLLNGHTLTLTGPTGLFGVVEGSGTVVIAGSAEMSGFQILDSATISITGSVTEDSVDSLGTGGSADVSAIDVAASGTYDLIADAGINASGPVTIDNAGLFEKTAGINTSNISGTFNNTGTIAVDTGTVILYSGGQIGGTIEGAGSFGLAVGNFTLEAGVVIDTPTFFLALNGDGFGATATLDTDLNYTGSFFLDQLSGNPTFLELNGHTADFSGTTELFAIIDGPGTLDLAGPTEFDGFTARGGVTIDDTGNIDQSGRFDLNGTMTVHSGVNWSLRDSVTTTTDSTAAIANAGTIEQTSGDNEFSGITLANTGSILIDEGVLTLFRGTETLGGTIAGAGELQLAGGEATLESGLNLAIAAIDLQNGSATLQASLIFAGPFTMTGEVLVLGGNDVALTGTSALNGTIQDAGTVSLLNGQVTQLTLGGGVLLEDAGTVVQTSFVDFGITSTDAASLQIDAGKLWHIVNGGGFIATGTAEINNAGTILRDGAAGSDYFYGTIVNTGTMAFAIGFSDLIDGATNDGQITIANGELQISQQLTADTSQAGTVTIGSYGTLLVTGSIDVSQTIDFATAGSPTPQDGAGLLALGGGVLAAGTLLASITNFAEGDTIDLGTVVTSLGTPGPGVVSFINNTTTIGQLSLTEASGAGALTLVQNGLSDTLLEVACFAEGTRILTTVGEVPVEALGAGVEVPTLLGGGVRRVVWVGSTEIDVDRHPAAHRVLPVRVQAHAFGPDAPHRDLLLSPDHSVWIDGALVPIYLLLNGSSIRREPATGCVRYFHVELDQHAVLLAEGLPAESYLDTGNRALFSDAAGAFSRRRASSPPIAADSR